MSMQVSVKPKIRWKLNLWSSFQGVPPPEFESEDLDGVDGRKRRQTERDRKIGHRRINETGQVSYKKIETKRQTH